MKQSGPRFVGKRHTARSLALQVLLTCRHEDVFAGEALDRALAESSLSSADRRLATQLVYTVLRRRDTLAALLRPYRSPDHVESWIWEALCLGACQLALLTHIPPHAALHETVELAAQFNRVRGKGIINAVLRRLLPLIRSEYQTNPAADALPLEPGRHRQLTQPVFPDPAHQPMAYLAEAFSLPRWLVKRWHERCGWDECLRLGFWFAGPAPIWLRVNRLRTSRDDFLARLQQAGIAAEPGEHPAAVRLLESASIRELPGYADGWFSVQDESAMRVADALAPAPGSRVLDLCAAPGGKTTHLAELMQNQGQLIACDVDPRRLATVGQLCQRLGITIVQPQLLASSQMVSRGADAPRSLGGPFDAILVDVPCSNTGVLGRRPEVRWRLRPEHLDHLVALQTQQLLFAAESVRLGGAIVYSTCSIEPQENQILVQAVLQAAPHLLLEAEQEQVPGQPADGGYWARLRRKSL